jgi:hypothetical protein
VGGEEEKEEEEEGEGQQGPPSLPSSGPLPESPAAASWASPLPPSLPPSLPPPPSKRQQGSTYGDEYGRKEEKREERRGGGREGGRETKRKRAQESAPPSLLISPPSPSVSTRAVFPYLGEEEEEGREGGGEAGTLIFPVAPSPRAFGGGGGQEGGRGFEFSALQGDDESIDSFFL